MYHGGSFKGVRVCAIMRFQCVCMCMAFTIGSMCACVVFYTPALAAGDEIYGGESMFVCEYVHTKRHTRSCVYYFVYSY